MRSGTKLKAIKQEDNGSCTVPRVDATLGRGGTDSQIPGGAFTVYVGEFNIFQAIPNCSTGCNMTSFVLSSISPNFTKIGQPTTIAQAFFQEANKNGTVVSGTKLYPDLGFGFAIWNPSINAYNASGMGSWQCAGGNSGNVTIDFQLKVGSLGTTVLNIDKSVCPESVSYNLTRNSVGALGPNEEYLGTFGCSFAYNVTSSPSSPMAQYGILQTLQWSDVSGFINPRQSGAIRKGNGKIIDCPVDLDGQCKSNESIKNIVEVKAGESYSPYTVNNIGSVFTSPYILQSTSQTLSPVICYKAFDEGDVSLYTNYTSYLMVKINGSNNFWMPVNQASLSVQVPSGRYNNGYGDCYAYCQTPPCGLGGTVGDPFNNAWNVKQGNTIGPVLNESWVQNATLPSWDHTSLPLDQGVAVVAAEGAFENSQGSFYYYCNWAYNGRYCPSTFPDLSEETRDGEGIISSNEIIIEYDLA